MVRKRISSLCTWWYPSGKVKPCSFLWNMYKVPWCTEALCYVGGEKMAILTENLWEKITSFLSSSVQTHLMSQPILKLLFLLALNWHQEGTWGWQQPVPQHDGLWLWCHLLWCQVWMAEQVQGSAHLGTVGWPPLSLLPSSPSLMPVGFSLLPSPAA